MMELDDLLAIDRDVAAAKLYADPAIDGLKPSNRAATDGPR